MKRYWPLLLLMLLPACEGYRFRCYWACIDQTAVQNDYVSQRDRCRQYAQLKLDMAMKNAQINGVDEENDEKAQKTMLVSLFSDCMGSNGWSVPDGKGETTKTANGPPPAGNGIAGAATDKAATERAQKVEAKSALSRTAECDFARQNAANSSISATRAKACDLECSQGIQAAPEAPRPAACPSNPNTRLSTGSEHTD